MLGKYGLRLMVKNDWTQGDKECETWKRSYARIPLFLFNLYNEYPTKEALEGFGDFKIGGQVIHDVKYADDYVLLAKKEMVL